jgi:N-acetylglucosaminyl-diphospho-decaprenol L-rhamnosyltransferase
VGVRARAIVVDNGSEHFETADLPIGTAVLLLPENLGYGAAFNRGLAEADAEWIVCANQDVEVEPSALAALVDAAERYERRTATPCIVGPRLLSPDGATAETCHSFPSLRQQVVAFLIGEDAAGYRNIADAASSEPTRCSWVSAAFVLARRSTFQALDGFDPSFFMYVEDLDLFDRAGALGFHCLWVPGATVVHFGGGSRIARPDVYAHCLWNWGVYFTRKAGRPAGAAIVAAAVAGSALRAALWGYRARRDVPGADEMATMFSRASVITLSSVVHRMPPAKPHTERVGVSTPHRGSS